MTRLFLLMGGTGARDFGPGYRAGPDAYCRQLVPAGSGRPATGGPFQEAVLFSSRDGQKYDLAVDSLGGNTSLKYFGNYRGLAGSVE